MENITISKTIVMESVMYDADKRREENRRKNTENKIRIDEHSDASKCQNG